MKRLFVTLLGICLLSGCSERPQNTAPPESQSQTRTAAAPLLQAPLSEPGAQIAQQLTANYNNQAINCGAASAPAFLCSGVILRTTTVSDEFDPWDHSAFSKLTNAVSFAYLRADSKFGRAPWGVANGYILYPILQTPEGKIRPQVICFFPLDGATFYRNAAKQFGCRDSIVTFPYPNVSRPCREQGITTAEQWLTHFRDPAGKARPNAYACSFMVNDDLNTEATTAFNQALRVRSALIPDDAFREHNELRIEAWPEFQPAPLPIMAFFYLEGGLANAQTDQRKYFDRTGGQIVPIIKLTLPPTLQQNATFQYFEVDQVVTPVTPEKPNPTVQKAYLSNGEYHLRLADIYTDTHVNVDVPQYSGMAATDTLMVRWIGRARYNSEIMTVGTPGVKTLSIPRIEVVDNIGRSVAVGYTVKTSPTATPVESQRLTLHIDPQALNLPPPTYSAGKVTLDFGGTTGYTSQVRWTGIVERDTPTQPVTTGQQQTFTINPSWISENRSKTVLINYSVWKTGTVGQKMFSQVLRAPIP